MWSGFCTNRPARLEQQSAADQAAFYATYRITDPEKRLAALENFLSDHPKSSLAANAAREMLKIVIKKWPKDKTRVLKAAHRVTTAPEDGAGGSGYQFAAKELLSAEIFLDEAENFASRSLDLLNKDNFFESQKKMYSEWKRPLPPEDALNSKYLSELAGYRTTLGRIYLKQSKTAEGEKILKEAFTVDPLLSPADLGLSEIAQNRGDLDTALDYLLTATATAKYTIADTHGRLEALYRKSHNGSLDGLDSMLDARHQKLFPHPIEVSSYKPEKGHGDRVVLAEYFTGAG